MKPSEILAEIIGTMTRVRDGDGAQTGESQYKGGQLCDANDEEREAADAE